ncbi:MAG: 2,3,4,5-tetrahydropyridine-2,6-dicarboxylate N-succinyltransferase, partial [Bacteroidota bacterium]
MQALQSLIEKAWEERSLLEEADTLATVRQVIDLLDRGELRVAEPSDRGEWVVNQWVKKAVVLYFPIQKMETIEVGPFEFHDK